VQNRVEVWDSNSLPCSVTWDTNVHKVWAKLAVDPMELLRMINGRAIPTKAIVAGLAKELDSDPSYLEKLADEIRKDLGAKWIPPPGTK
jgi:hypothetical protein